MGKMIAMTGVFIITATLLGVIMRADGIPYMLYLMAGALCVLLGVIVEMSIKLIDKTA